MKKLMCALLLMIASSSVFAGAGCPMSSEENLVCSVVLCNPIGLAINESRNDCLKVNRDFAIYLATLGFWDHPPKCKMRDMNCNKVGTAKKGVVAPSVCIDPNTGAMDLSCAKGVNVNNASCDELSGAAQQSCYLDLAKANNDCSQLSGNDKDQCIAAVTTYNTDTTTDPDTGAITETTTGTNNYSGDLVYSVTKVTTVTTDPDTGLNVTTVTTTDNLTGHVSTETH